MSVPHYGDFPTNHTAVCMPWGSYSSASGAPSATTNFAAADILIYKDGGTTQRTSANGIVVSTSFDGQTGLQMVTIDLSDNTDVGFYAAGHEYQVGVADVTIDSQTVRFWLGTFSIERAGGTLALVKLLPTVIRIKKNTALAGFTFAMVSSTDHVTPATGLTVTGIVSKDGGATGALTNAVAEISGGLYKVDFAAGDVNGNVVAMKFTAPGADPLILTIVTQP